MRVVLARCAQLQRNLLDAVYEILIAVPGPLEFDKAAKPVALNGVDCPVDWDTIFNACRSARQKLGLREEDFLVLLMDRRNTLNWFSSCDPQGGRNVFIHAADWDTYVACAPEHPVAFQVVENVFQILMFDNLGDGAKFFHDPPIGCVNDMCSWKPDVTFKLRTADVCLECQRVIKDRAIPDLLLQQALEIFEQQRQAMLLRAPILATRSNLEFPFPIAITRRKISGTTEPFRKFLMLLDYFDALVRCTVITGGCITMKDDFAEFFRNQCLHERPSLGHWVTALRVLCQRRQAMVPDLPTTLFGRIHKVVNKAEEAGIVSLRNERRGHGYCDCRDETYKQLFLEHLPTVSDIEALLRPMYARTKWCYTLSMTHPSPGMFAFKVRDLTGDHPDFNECEHELRPTAVEDLPSTGTVYAVVGPDAWYSLTPSSCADLRW
jgi:hypothetical protein